MKKIISLVVAAMMIMSLFAVNVGAVVTHGSVEEPVVSQDFSGDYNSYWTGSGYNSSGEGSLTVENGKLIWTDGDKFHGNWDCDNLNVPADVTSYTYSFDVVAVNPLRAIQFVIASRNKANVFPNPYSASTKEPYATAKIYPNWMEKGATYSFKITVDEAATTYKGIFTILYSKDGGDWTILEECGHTWDWLGQEGNPQTVWTYRAMTHNGVSGATNGSVGYLPYISGTGKLNNDITAEELATAEYHFDNFALTYEKPLQSTGVVLSQDYEDAGNGAFFAGRTEGRSDVTRLTEEDGNAYMNVKSAQYPGLGDWNHFSVSSNPAGGSSSHLDLTGDFALQFDMRMNVRSSRGFGIDFFTSSTAARTGITVRDFDSTPESLEAFNQQYGANINPAGGIDAGKWYTFKIAYVDGVVSMRRADRGGNTWIVPHFSIDVDQMETSGAGIISITGNTANGGGGNVADYDFDNIYFTNLEQMYMGDVTADEAMVYISEFEYEDGAAYGDANLTAVLAAFDGDGKLVDAAFQTANAAAGFASFADLGMRSSGDKVYLYVWDTLANAKPVMDTPYLVYSAQ